MDLMLRLEPDSGVPLYQQVMEQVRSAILSGRLAPGARLPSSRDLARVHGIARNTATLAYQLLASEGYLDGRERSGHFVSPEIPDAGVVAGKGAQPARVDTDQGKPVRVSRWAEAVAGVSFSWAEAQGLSFDFRPHYPARDVFPADEWRRGLLQALEGGAELLEYGDPAGYGPLREAVAAYASRSRGCVCTPSQVVITTGARQAIHLLALTLLNPGDAAVMEEPGYPSARQALEAFGARILPIPVDERGLQVDQLAAAHDVRLVYVTPSNQYPTGATLDLGRRLRLLEWARRTGALVVEDDYDGDFRYEGRPLQALQGLDGGGRVAYVGTFAKSLAPGLRLGYLILPEELVGHAVRAKWLVDRQTPALPQAALAAFMSGGGFERHLRRARMLFRRRRDAFLAALERHLPGAVPGPATAGMQVLVTLPGVDTAAAEAALVKRARQAGVALQPARPCFARQAPPGRFLFWFSHMSAEQVEEGVRRLAELLEPSA